jgi:hypothetical protein
MSPSTTASLGRTLMLAALCLPGCAMWTGDRQKQQSGPAPGQCSVELKSASGKVQVGHLDLAPEATVQSVLEKTKANRKYSRSTVELQRKLPSGEWHKMGVDYDSGTKRIDPLHDYHVQPGDRVIVTEDTSSGLDDLMKEQTGPFSSIFGS